jgi:hypothetical protein
MVIGGDGLVVLALNGFGVHAGDFLAPGAAS